MPVDRRVHLAARRHDADADRLVLAVDLARGERLGERGARRLAARDDQEPRGVLVEPVHDAGARQLREPRVVREQRVLQRVVRIAGAGMHDEARRLVDDQDVLVLPGDRRARCPARRPRRRPRPGASSSMRSPPATMSRGRGTRPSTRSMPVVDPALQARARELGQGVGERLVEAPSGRLRRQAQFALVTGGTHAGRERSFAGILRRFNSRGPVLCSQPESMARVLLIACSVARSRGLRLQGARRRAIAAGPHVREGAQPADGRRLPRRRALLRGARRALPVQRGGAPGAARHHLRVLPRARAGIRGRRGRPVRPREPDAPARRLRDVPARPRLLRALAELPRALVQHRPQRAPAAGRARARSTPSTS